MHASALSLALTLLAAAGEAEVTAQQRIEALAHYRNGEELMRQETFEEAASEFRAATHLDPLFVLAHYSLGQALMALKRYPDAVSAFLDCRTAVEQFGALRQRDRAAAERRITDEVRELKDHITAIQSGRIKTASGNATILSLEERIRVLEDARLRGAEDRGLVPAEFSLALGSAYFRNGQVREAEREYKAAIAVNPKLGAAHNNLAAIYLMAGRLDEAEQAVKRAEKSGFKVDPRLKQDIQQARAVQNP